MKAIGVIQTSFDVTPLGTRSRLAELLARTPILRRTVQQVRKSKKLDEVYVLVPETQFPLCRNLLPELDIRIHAIACDPPPWARLVRASRKWSLDGWRGGIGGSTIFDEFLDCRVLAGVLQICPADAVLSITAAAPLFDPGFADEMISHRETFRDEARLTFTQAVPGLSGIVLDVALVRELASRESRSAGCFRTNLISPRRISSIPAPLRFASGRLIADTDSALLSTLREMFAQKEMWSLAEIGQFLEEGDERGVASFPREVEIELTCDDP